MESIDLLSILKEVNIIQLISIGIMLYFFYNRLNGKIERLSCRVDDIDKRLCRIEGSLSVHGHCMFSQNKNEKRVD